MKKVLAVIQKISVWFALFATAVTFIYSLGFATSLYPTFYLTDFGQTFYADIQPLNRQMLTFSLVGLILVLILFIYNTANRRTYYVTNAVAILIYSVYSLIVAFTFLPQFPVLKVTYATIDFTFLDMVGTWYVKEPKIFDLGHYVYAVYIASAILLIVLLATKMILRFMDMRKADRSHGH